ncbi:FAD-dependent oxidoreductase [Brevundimonas intermedia]|uniref:FAD-dependent oxidoreductase n=1 Tax=Brevundimonas intermedia TaxID=74315 RepID=UPI0032093B28
MLKPVVCDVAIIGAGSAGLAAYHAAKATGAKVLLIEAGAGGPTCARYGCMPSKLLLAAARAARDAKAAEMFAGRCETNRVTLAAPPCRINARSATKSFRRRCFFAVPTAPHELLCRMAL